MFLDSGRQRHGCHPRPHRSHSRGRRGHLHEPDLVDAGTHVQRALVVRLVLGINLHAAGQFQFIPLAVFRGLQHVFQLRLHCFEFPQISCRLHIGPGLGNGRVLGLQGFLDFTLAHGSAQRLWDSEAEIEDAEGFFGQMVRQPHAWALGPGPKLGGAVRRGLPGLKTRNA